ncbi:hypothetical protein [Flagellimonas meridianipacifica]|uniref:Uncharacterized protein n=1 Tax=Flagellimonas meridianipacifica TaxID=1080225 RepID=A0A2T0MC02_9FLAO|nr:hypothetical protein [Allomuricauda pacifica]PRX55034.1 hypothetical protein CLV81_3440 [Allomuricauda pacifica]
MNKIFKILTWKSTNLITAFILSVLVVLSFYGVYTNSFYLTKPDNYIFPLLSIIHFLYIYVIWFKIKEDELPDPKMRNLEYALYAVMVVYAFKIYESIVVLNSVSDLQEHYIPETFFPMITTILVLYCLLFIITLFSFAIRKRQIGVYNFENFNDNLNMWQ